MPHISKNQLKEDVFLKIYNQFSNTVSGSQKKQEVLNDLLTDTEKIMFAKRLAVIFMILEGASFYHIQESLNVSTSTTGRFSRNLNKGTYSHIKKLFYTKQKKKDFWDTLEVVVRAGMPPMGRGRWQWLNDMDKKYK